MRVVHVPRRFAPSHWGGTETCILEVCKRLRRDGHETWIACPDALTARPLERIQGVPVRRFPFFYPYLHLTTEACYQLDLSGGNMFSFQLMRALWKWPRLELVHLHTGRRTGAIGRYVAMKRRIPYVVSLHGGLYDVPSVTQSAPPHPAAGHLEWGKVLGWWVGSHRVLEDASAIICVGRAEHHAVSCRHPGSRVVHLPHGVDTDRFASGDGDGFRRQLGIPPDAHLLVTVGRIHPHKNQALLVRLLPALRRQHGDVRLAIIGPITDEACHRTIRQAAAQLPPGTVHLVPGLGADSSALVDAYHAADCFVLPSLHEPFGIVVLEAWAAGRPVVVSRVGGLADLVEHGIDGMVCDSGDEAAFHRSISTLIENRSLRVSLGMAGWRKARAQFAWDTQVRRLEHLYEEVVREHPVRA